MAQETLHTRKRLARIVGICGLFLLSAAFAALPVAADKGGGNDKGGNKVETGQMHDRDNHGQDVADKDANEHHTMVDNDANEHHDAVDNDTNEPPATADNDANDNDDDDVAMPTMVPTP